MKLFLLFDFVKWCVTKTAGGFVKRLGTFNQELARYPAQTIAFWLVANILAACVVIILTLAMDIPPGPAVSMFWILSTVYLAANLILVAYKAYDTERLELLNKLKGTK